MTSLQRFKLDWSNIDNSPTIAPLSTSAILLPLFAFPSWILCTPSMIWQFRQGNVSAGSLILWVYLLNFFLSINSLIWPRDNLMEWWDGNIWCDIHTRIHIGGTIGTCASTVMIVRKLAKVMDTRNLTVSTSRGSKRRETALEIVWCWVYPLVLILVYYIVQPARYIIWGIVGCLTTLDGSWPSIVLSFIWPAITILVAAGYAALLIYRLHRYRREFTTLCSARSTTKSRFVRLFLICIAIIVVYLPWTIYLLVKTSLQSHDPYDWDRVHDPRIFNSIIRIPAYGQVSIGKWVQVATGYWMFFIFGTGSDARNQYKQMLIGIGLGKLFPSLHNMHHTGNSTPSSFGAAKSWTLDLPSKAKKLFLSRRGSVIEMTSMSRSTVDDRSTSPSEVHHLRTISTEEPILQKPITAKEALTGNNRPLFLQRVFRPSAAQLSTLLPIFALSKRTASPTSDTQDSACRVASRGVSTHAWAVDREDSERISEADGVHVVKEVH